MSLLKRREKTILLIMHVKPLSRLEKESKHSNMLLPTGDLPKLRNSHDLDSAAGMKKKTGYVLM